MAAICVHIDIATSVVDGVVTAFAKNDLLLKAMAVFEHEANNGEPMVPLDPCDEYFTAPYALVNTSTRRKPAQNLKKETNWLVFTCGKVRLAHDAAIASMKKYKSGVVAVGSVGGLERGELVGAKIPKSKWLPFREHAFQGGDDVCSKLEDWTFYSACRILGVASDAIPVDWRALRTAKLAAMTVDLASEALASAPLATLPTWGVVPFPRETSTDRAEAEAGALEARAEKERRDKKRKADCQ